MHKLIINNFGPIKKVELDIKDYLIFIGPQASGKSTISKSVYFFRSLRDDWIRFVLECIEKNKFVKPIGRYAKFIRKKFIDFWGPSFHLEDIKLEYIYTDSNKITITLEKNNRFINPGFSDNLKHELLLMVNEAKKFSQKNESIQEVFLSSQDLIQRESDRREFFNKGSFSSHGNKNIIF